MIWKVTAERGGMVPLGGLTRNLSGEDVWTLKATEESEQRERRWTLALHLRPSSKSMITSDPGETSTSFFLLFCSSIS